MPGVAWSGARRGTMLLRVHVDSSRRIEFQDRLLEDRLGRIGRLVPVS